MKGYKGFNPNMTCLNKQYTENTVFEENEAQLCNKGMHFCSRPIDVLKYYSPCDDIGNLNEFCEVEALDEALTNDGEKYCTKKLKIGAKIGIVGLIKAEVEYIKEQIRKTPDKLKAVNSGDSSAAVNSGDRSAAVNSGDSSAAVNSGEEGVAIALGIDSRAKAALGGWIVLTEWKYNGKWHRTDLQSAQVDGAKIKADTWYKLIDGKFVEVSEQK